MKILFTFALLLIMAGNLLPQSYNSDGYTGKIHPTNPTGKILFSHALGDTIFTAAYITKVDQNFFIEFSVTTDKGLTWKQKQHYAYFNLISGNWTPGENGDFWFTGILDTFMHPSISHSINYRQKALYRFNIFEMKLDTVLINDSIDLKKFFYFGGGKGIITGKKVLYFGEDYSKTNFQINFYKTQDYGKSWEVISPSTLQSNAKVLSIFSFVDSLNGLAAANLENEFGERSHRVYKTTNGGRSWNLFTYDRDFLSQIEFADRVNGFRTRSIDVIGFSEKITYLEYSTDGGFRWTISYFTTYPENPKLKIAKVINKDSLYLTLHVNKLFLATDKGRKHNFIIDGYNQISGLSFQNSNIFTVNYIPWEISYTRDAGKTFTKLKSNKFNGHVLGIKIFSPDTLYMITSTGKAFLVKSFDGGKSFESTEIPQLTTHLSYDIYNVEDPRQLVFDYEFLSKDDIVVSGKNIIVKTSDGGKTWKKIFAQDVYVNFVDRISFVDPLYGFVLGKVYVPGGSYATQIYKTTDGGITWKEKLVFSRKQYNNRTNAYVHLSFPTREIGYLTPGYGPIIKTTDGGNSWFELDTANFDVTWKYCFYDYIYAPDTNLVYAAGHFALAGYPQIRKSTDGGLTWHLSRRGFAPNRIRTTPSKTIIGLDYNYTFTLGYNYGDSIWYKQMNVGNITAFDLMDTLLIYGGTEGTLYKRYIPRKRMIVDVNEENFILPDNFSLEQNYPNPFNPSTAIRYNIKESGFVVLKVFNFLGEEVKVLVNKEQTPGVYEVLFNGSNLASGIYFYRITSGKFSETKKMVMIK